MAKVTRKRKRITSKISDNTAKLSSNKKKQTPTTPVDSLVAQKFSPRFVTNTTELFSRSVLNRLLNVGKDINYECGYPEDILISDYKGMYDREGMGERVVKLMPEESWAMPPRIYEDEDTKETEFEARWEQILKEKNLYHYLLRADIMSGIGQFGVLLIGIDDGQTLDKPVEGVEEYFKSGANIHDYKFTGKERNIIYLRPFDESVIQISRVETNHTHPRFGFPVTYKIEFEDTLTKGSKASVIVHWTRVLHLADNRNVSETHGKPRQKSVYNRLLDIRKILSGSGEMFWKGAFPGYAFEIDKEVTLSDDDKTALKKEFEDYSQGLQRYMALGGITAKSLTPQTESPAEHIEAQLRNIAITIGVPYRVFVGSEQAQLASGQDIRTWNKRVAKRQNGYLTELLLRPFIDLLILYGVLPQPKAKEYFVEWPDLNAPSDEDAAKVALVKTEALAKYVAGDVVQIIAHKEFLVTIMGMTEDEAEALVKAADAFQDAMSKDEEDAAEKERAREDEVRASEQGGKVELEVVKQSGGTKKE